MIGNKRGTSRDKMENFQFVKQLYSAIDPEAEHGFIMNPATKLS